MCCAVVWVSFVVWCGVVWCGVVWCGVVWCGDVRLGAARHLLWCCRIVALYLVARIVVLRVSLTAPSRGSDVPRPSQVKCRLQAQSAHFQALESHSYRGVWHGLRSIYSAGGVAGLFRGATAAMIRVAVGGGVQLSSYDTSKVLVMHYGGAHHRPSSVCGCACFVVRVRRKKCARASSVFSLYILACHAPDSPRS